MFYRVCAYKSMWTYNSMCIYKVEYSVDNFFCSRRAKPMINGTSDDTDSSSSMTPKKSAALSKAIQKGKLGKEVGI